MIEPESKLTVVSLGSAKGWASNCWGGYDDAYTVALVWNLLGPTLQQRNDSEEQGVGTSNPHHNVIAWILLRGCLWLQHAVKQLRETEERRLAAEREAGLVKPDVDGRKKQEMIGEEAKRAVAASGVEIQGSCESPHSLLLDCQGCF